MVNATRRTSFQLSQIFNSELAGLNKPLSTIPKILRSLPSEYGTHVILIVLTVALDTGLGDEATLHYAFQEM